MPRRQKIPLRRLTSGERDALEQIARASRERADLVARAKILLAVADGARFTEAARLAGRRSGDAVARLVARWNADGLAALETGRDRPPTRRPQPPAATPAATLDVASSPHPASELSPTNGVDALPGRIIRSTDLNATLRHALQIDGALAVALVDIESGMVLGAVERAGGPGTIAGFDLDVAAAGNTEVVRAKLATIQALGLTTGIEDILISLTNQYHLIRPLGSDPGVFLYLVLDRLGTQLALARRGLSQIEGGLVV